jgi:hypothetical protein
LPKAGADDRSKIEGGGSDEAAEAAPVEQPVNGLVDEPLPVGVSDSNGDSMKDELPPVEELVRRLRPEVLTALDELFRAKWTSVKRLRPEDLKS